MAVLLSAVALVALCVAVAGCGSSSSSSSSESGSSTTGGGTDETSTAASAEEGSKGKIGVIIFGANTYNNCWTTGTLKALEGTGYEAKLLNSQAEPSKEIANFQTLVGEGVKGILSNPTSPESTKRGALIAKQSGIPTVIGGWNPPATDGEEFVGKIYIDDPKGIEVTTDWVKENVDPTEVLLVYGAPGDPTSEAWADGITEAIDGLGGGFKVVDKQPGMFDRTASQTAAENMFTAHPDAGLIIAYAAEMAIGVSNYLQRSGNGDVQLVSSDWSPEMEELMEEGKISADRYYSPAQQGILGIETLLKSVEEDGKYQGIVKVPNELTTGETMKAAVEKTPACYDEFLGQAEGAS